ncbi:MAG: DNA mismatch repair protein MutS [Flavobacteriales bacterium]|jgi:DNA mismatch repair protein MutS|nr:DNA mismatch repair protein MutS [Flavobacteriales bacterium]
MGSKSSTKKRSETPLMTQYYGIKAKHPGALLLFRVGDFYETFAEDAVRASKILGIVLTQRKNGAASSVELAGFPHHSLDVYLPKLVRAGERVAICDQLEDPKMTKSIVKRGVTELVTPGVALNDQILDRNSNNFLCAIHFGKPTLGVSFLDISTGEFYAAQGSAAYIEKLVIGFSPGEIVFERNKRDVYKASFSDKFHTYHLEDWVFQPEYADDTLKAQFHTHSLKGFGLDDLPEAIIASGAILHYLSETQHDKLRHIHSVSRIDASSHMWLDRFTQKNLELFYSSNENGKSLLDVIDTTITPMGSRMLKNWLAFPLIEAKKINERLSSVESFIKHETAGSIIADQLKKIGDLERITARLSIGKLGPKEAIQLGKSLEAAMPIVNIKPSFPQTKQLKTAMEGVVEIAALIKKTLNDNPPALINKGNAIADAINEELDDLRIIAFSGKDYLVQLQNRESKATGISSLKIGFNNVFGYYLEVTHAHKDKVPASWIRKQTLVNAERYITEELKGYEERILGAEEKILALEQKIYTEFLQELGKYIAEIQRVAKVIAEIDCLCSFSRNAIDFKYCRPKINSGHAISIRGGRHPVIERQMPLGEAYIANDIEINNSDQQIIMLTGPNMSGKSALLRQCALITLLAQIGSYVPADSAELGLIDKLFTRVGASDNISQGESTFMVEMNETASILNNLSSRSLILLDEIGRGTSTYDGISIAWSIAEYLHQQKERPLTLFATHYHELNDMAAQFERIKNFTISIKETKHKIIFLRKLIAGGSEHSFGIQVAKMAGMPPALIVRAKKILHELEESQRKGSAKPDTSAISNDLQLSIFQLDDPVLSQIKEELINIEINSLTPVEALFKLNEIKKLLGTNP